MSDLKPATPEDALNFRSVSDVQLSPNGSAVAYVVGDNYSEESNLPKSSIWIVQSAGGTPKQFAGPSVSDVAPRWSPDSKTIAFLSKKPDDEQRQLFVQDVSSGNARRVFDQKTLPLPKIFRSVAWCPEGKRISFIGKDPETEHERQKKLAGNDEVEADNNDKYSRLYVVTLDTGEVKCISPAGIQIWESCWSPDGREIAAVSSDLPTEGDWYKCQLITFPTRGGPAIKLHSSRRQVAAPSWSPDGDSIAFLTSTWSDRGLHAGEVMVVSAKDGSLQLECRHPVSTHTLSWLPDSQSIFTISQKFGGTELAKIDVTSGTRNSLWEGQETLASANTNIVQGKELVIAVIREDADNPPDPWLAKIGSDRISWKRLAKANPIATVIQLGQTEEVRWKGAQGWDMHGILIRPTHISDGPNPMVTVIHGGPTWAHLNQYYASDSWFQALANRGIAVFLPNPRGSTGRGLEFAEANIGELGGKDWDDVHAGITHCITRGIADPNKLGIAGSSYGGFLTAWGITQTGIFKAAVIKAGICDWRAFHGSSLIHDWDKIHHGGADPWDAKGQYSKRSPITHVRNVHTPTLILHGMKDRAVPVEQSYIFYRALQDFEVESKLVLYPREGHSIKERQHKLDVMQRSVDWLYKKLS